MLLIHLVVSFLIGGGVVALLSLLAEKADKNIAGVILMFPTTVVVGFFFLGVSTSAENVSEIVPATLIPLGFVIMSSIIYIYFALLYEKIFSARLTQIVFSFVSTSVVWFLLALPCAIYSTGRVYTGLAGYLALIALAHFILNRKNLPSAPEIIMYGARQKVFRAAFIGTVIMMVVFAGKILSPFWGGLFTMYPAATLSTLIVIHYHHKPSSLFYFFRRAPLGSLSIALYCLMVLILYPSHGIITGTFLSLVVCILFSFSIIKFQKAYYGKKAGNRR